MEYCVVVRPDGAVEFVYSDDLRPLLEAGESTIRRASHVEPTPDGRWQADLTPVGGPVLPATETRQQSLRQETEWIETNILGPRTRESVHKGRKPCIVDQESAHRSRKRP